MCYYKDTHILLVLVGQYHTEGNCVGTGNLPFDGQNPYRWSVS